MPPQFAVLAGALPRAPAVTHLVEVGARDHPERRKHSTLRVRHALVDVLQQRIQSPKVVLRLDGGAGGLSAGQPQPFVPEELARRVMGLGLCVVSDMKGAAVP